MSKQTDIPDFLKPLQDKLQLVDTSGKNGKPLNLSNSPVKQQLVDVLNQGYKKVPEGSKELADFIVNQLATNQRFKGVNLYPKQDSDIQGAYDFNEKNLGLAPIPNPKYKAPNPITTLIHEGTHGLDDLHMNTYQKTAMDFLNKHFKDQKINEDAGDWYIGAQNIIDPKAFKTLYPYKTKSKKDEDVRRGLLNNYKTLTGNEEANPTFGDIYTALNNPENDNRKNSFLFSHLSEFPAFAVENLPNKWYTPDWESKKRNPPLNEFQYISHGEKVQHPRANQPVMVPPKGYDNMGRKFLKHNIKDVYSNFVELNPNFATQHPNANRSFMDRIGQLRNQNKYATTEDYINHLRTNGKIFDPNRVINNPNIKQEPEGLSKEEEMSDIEQKNLLQPMQSLSEFQTPIAWNQQQNPIVSSISPQSNLWEQEHLPLPSFPGTLSIAQSDYNTTPTKSEDMQTEENNPQEEYQYQTPQASITTANPVNQNIANKPKIDPLKLRAPIQKSKSK